MTQLILPVGRIVQGHPMTRYKVLDDVTKQQKIMKNDELQFNTHIAFAIEKILNVDWKQTPWGQVIYNEGLTAWPNGETAIPSFSWKIVDGDSKIPNEKMNIPCEQEAFPGHWIIHISSLNSFACYHNDQFAPHEQIQDEKEIKTGDYGQVIMDIRGNNPTVPKAGHKAGLYLDGKVFSLRQVGKKIVSKNEVDVVKAMAGNTAVMPNNMVLDEGIPQETTTATQQGPGNTPPPPPQNTVVQADDFTNQFVLIADGSRHSIQSLLDGGWQQAMIDALPRA